MSGPNWGLRVSTWRGISAFAVHWYGRLTPDCEHSRFPCPCPEDIEIAQPVTAELAQRLDNDSADRSWSWGEWLERHPEDALDFTTKCFYARQEVIEAGVRIWRERGLGGVLYIGEAHDEKRTVLMQAAAPGPTDEPEATCPGYPNCVCDVDPAAAPGPEGSDRAG